MNTPPIFALALAYETKPNSFISQKNSYHQNKETQHSSDRYFGLDCVDDHQQRPPYRRNYERYWIYAWVPRNQLQLSHRYHRSNLRLRSSHNSYPLQCPRYGSWNYHHCHWLQPTSFPQAWCRHRSDRATQHEKGAQPKWGAWDLRNLLRRAWCRRSC